MSTPTRRAGVLLHPTSLPGPYGIGDLGAGAGAFIEWLAHTGCTSWQVLPLVPPGAGNSPYSSWSAFAGNPLLIDLIDLARAGLLTEGEIEPPHALRERRERVDFGAVLAYKRPRLDAAADRLRRDANHPWHGELAAFRAANDWLPETALFAALKAAHGDQAWWDWPAPLRDRDPEALAAAREQHADAIERVEVIQYLFQRQWDRLRGVCQRHGIELIGDLPIYVDGDSADVWANRDLFALEADGRPAMVSGVPPDAFSATGQLWGNPLYRWDRLAADGYAWWIARLRRVLSLTDRVRIDHFRAFSAYWAIPASSRDARSGKWVKGPGRAVFDAFEGAFGRPLPIIAEDLGDIDQPVRDLLASTGLPGMKVLQFAFGDKSDNLYLPHNHRPDAVVYTGTHDNDTTLGWWLAASEKVRHHVRIYFRIDGNDVVWDLIRAAYASPCALAIVPMQDVLALDSKGRMNTPSVAEGNWGWRVRADQLHRAHADRLRGLAALFGRG